MLDSQDILNNFYNTIYAIVDKVYNTDSMADHLKVMSLETPVIASQIVSIGNQYDAIEIDRKDIQEGDVDKYIILFYWIEEAKNLMILWRDTLLEETKAYHYQQDELLDIKSIDKLLDQSQSTFKKCISSLKEIYPSQLKALGKDQKSVKNQLLDWEKQIDPWGLYHQQIKQLMEQSRNISNVSNQIGRSNSYYKRIKKILTSYIDRRISNMDEISHLSEMALNTINNDINEVDINSKIQQIEGVHNSLNKLFVDGHHLEQIEKINEQLTDNIEVPVSSNNGILNVKKISLSKLTQQWLESEIYLTLYEVEEVEDQLKNSLKTTLVNIQNHFSLLKNEGDESKDALLIQGIENYKSEYQKIALKHKKLIDEARYKLKNEFNISEIYSDEHLFLPLPAQSSLGNIDLSRTRLRDKAMNWAKSTFTAYDELWKKAEYERKLSTSEKLVRYVDSRKFAADNRQYINIFLVKGYIGESFVIGRTDELEHFRSIYNNWQKGYRGSVMITGQRFSGKSLFAEYANIKVLDGNAILLMPNKEYIINGKTYIATHNLKESLSHVVKQTYDSKPVVIIDDLENWYSKEESLPNNTRELRRIIDKYSSKIFFVLTVSNWLQNKMDKVYDLSGAFQADINLDRMSLEEIRQIISIRQGATYKELLGKDGKKISAEEFNKRTKQLHQNVDGNVGDALSKWAAATKYHDANTVILTDKQFYDIPDIDDSDTLLLLETIMMARKSNEYYLNKYFGKAFRKRYSALLQRLINVGLITRNVDNLIQINPKVVNDIGRLLENKQYLRFNHT